MVDQRLDCSSNEPKFQHTDDLCVSELSGHTTCDVLIADFQQDSITKKRVLLRFLQNYYEVHPPIISRKAGSSEQGAQDEYATFS